MAMEFVLDRERSGGQIVSHSGRSIHANAQPEPQTENLDAAGSAESRCQTRAGREENARIVSVINCQHGRYFRAMKQRALLCLPGKGINRRLYLEHS